MTRIVKRRLSPTSEETPIVSSQVDAFSKRLHYRMLELGLNQTDVARLLYEGKTKTDKKGNTTVAGRDRVSSWIRGKSMPSPLMLKRLAEKLDTTTEDLAPNLKASAIEKENPAFNISFVAGHSDRCLLRVNQLVPLSVALEVGRLIEGVQKK